MKIHKNLEQSTPAWFAIRKGKMTASHAQAIGNCGKGLDTYILELMAEFYSSHEEEKYNNDNMERGKELEDVARTVYEFEKKIRVETVGFVERDEFSGCSPDGLISDDGGLEIKCLNNKYHFNLILKKEKAIESKYIWQVQMNLLITERKWWDLVFYNPHYKKSLLVFQIRSDEEKQKKILEGLEIGKARIIEIKKRLTQ